MKQAAEDLKEEEGETTEKEVVEIVIDRVADEGKEDDDSEVKINEEVKDTKEETNNSTEKKKETETPEIEEPAVPPASVSEQTEEKMTDIAHQETTDEVTDQVDGQSATAAVEVEEASPKVEEVKPDVKEQEVKEEEPAKPKGLNYIINIVKFQT